MEKACNWSFAKIIKIFFAAISFIVLILFPQEIGDGVKSGLYLLGNSVIPALFPFMLLSTYISFSPCSRYLSLILERPAQWLFGINGTGLCAVVLGILGGYPIGAKTVAEFFEQRLLSQYDTKRLLSWCVNPSPAFVITAIGTFLLRNTSSGIIMYVSILLSSITIGIANKFMISHQKTSESKADIAPLNESNIFISSVTSGSKAMLSVCGWVLTFSAICAGIDCITYNKNLSLLIKSVSEVTNGCSVIADTGLPLPVLCALLGFGGFAVIFQVAPYLQMCNYSLKIFICWRIVIASLSAFYCSILIKIFPKAHSVIHVIAIGDTNLTLSHSIGASIILLITCIVLILEVDNKRKVW